MSELASTPRPLWCRQLRRQQWRAFRATFFGWLLDGFGFTIMTFILVDIQEEVHAGRGGGVEDGHSVDPG
jgi:SHS family sialic acid transporter-like MFS transporter